MQHEQDPYNLETDNIPAERMESEPEIQLITKQYVNDGFREMENHGLTLQISSTSSGIVVQEKLVAFFGVVASFKEHKVGLVVRVQSGRSREWWMEKMMIKYSNERM